MTNLDYGRLQDLEELDRDYKIASGARRLEIERTMAEIIRQSKGTYQLRDELIRATRKGDRNRINYCREQLRIIRARELSGSRVQV